ncbi:SEL1-like repeat protein [Verrucomicrobia bacterium]|nr:SEL1-like repeat protein [Verrucomicrobiota bacterium]
MSAIMKLLPVAAAGVAGVAGFSGLNDNVGIIDRVTVAAVEGIEMPGIAEAVAAHYIEFEKLPIGDFSEFLKQNMRETKGGSTRDKTSDPWETPYIMTTGGRGFKIHCAGPDKEWKTEDDMEHSYDLAALGGSTSQPYAESGSRKGKESSQKPQRKKPTNKGLKPDRPSKKETDKKVVEHQIQRAADGSASAQYDLAMRHLTGDGVDFNIDKAMNLLRESAGQDYTKSTKKLEQLLKSK